MEPKADAGGRPARSALLELMDRLRSIAHDYRREAELWPKNERAQQVARMLRSHADILDAQVEAAGLAAEPKAPARSALLSLVQQLAKLKRLDGDGKKPAQGVWSTVRWRQNWRDETDTFARLALQCADELEMVAAGDRPSLDAPRIAEIRQRLAACRYCPNPWPDARVAEGALTLIRDALELREQSPWMGGTKPAADLIAHASSDIAWLLEQLAVGARPAPQEPPRCFALLGPQFCATYSTRAEAEKAAELNGMLEIYALFDAASLNEGALPVSSPAPAMPQDEQFILSPAAQALLLALLESPPEVNEALRRALQRHQVAAPVLPAPPHKEQESEAIAEEFITFLDTHARRSPDGDGPTERRNQSLAAGTLLSPSDANRNEAPLKQGAGSEPADAHTTPSTLPAILGTLPRYTPNGRSLNLSDHGAWVKFKDVEALVSALQHEIAQWKARQT